MRNRHLDKDINALELGSNILNLLRANDINYIKDVCVKITDGIIKLSMQKQSIDNLTVIFIAFARLIRDLTTSLCLVDDSMDLEKSLARMISSALISSSLLRVEYSAPNS